MQLSKGATECAGFLPAFNPVNLRQPGWEGSLCPLGALHPMITGVTYTAQPEPRVALVAPTEATRLISRTTAS